MRNIIWNLPVGEGTRRAYAAQMAKFRAWCRRRGTTAVPASPAIVATYLVDLVATGADPAHPARCIKVATVALAPARP